MAIPPTDEPQDTKYYMKISLWLLPPRHLRHSLSEQIANYAEANDASHPFEPHVTVIGGIPCESPEQLDEWSCILKEGLRQTGPIPCRFRKEVLSLHEEPSSSLIWNQASLCVMERSDQYIRLIHKSRELLGLQDEFQFRAPLFEPHYSFFYGKRNAPSPEEVSVPPDFDATEVALWCTHPSCLEGVPSWKELAIFDLC